MEQKPVPDQKPFMMGDQTGMDRLVGLEGYKGSPMEEHRMIECQHRLNSRLSEGWCSRGISCQSWEGLRAKDLLGQVESAEPNGRNNCNVNLF